jgi:hypothetical protein
MGFPLDSRPANRAVMRLWGWTGPPTLSAPRRIRGPEATDGRRAERRTATAASLPRENRKAKSRQSRHAVPAHPDRRLRGVRPSHRPAQAQGRAGGQHDRRQDRSGALRSGPRAPESRRPFRGLLRTDRDGASASRERAPSRRGDAMSSSASCRLRSAVVLALRQIGEPRRAARIARCHRERLIGDALCHDRFCGDRLCPKCRWRWEKDTRRNLFADARVLEELGHRPPSPPP